MSYKLHEEYSSAFTGPKRTPKGIAIHWWGDPAHKPTFWGIVNVLIERGEQQSASINFVAEAGIVACLVSSDTVAWGQGDGASGWGNLNCISIECNPRCTPGDRETVAELIADMRILWGNLPLYPHNDFTSTQCPGVWEQYLPWLDKRANEIVAAKKGKSAPAAPKPVVKPAPKPVVKPAPAKLVRKTYSNSEFHWVVSPKDTLSKIARYYGIPKDVNKIAAYNGIDPNDLKIGDRIWIPGPLVWVIEALDTICSIAKYYGPDAGYLARLNGLPSADSTIYTGNKLIIKK